MTDPLFPDPEAPAFSAATAHRDVHGQAWVTFAVGNRLFSRPIGDGAVATLHHALGVIREDRLARATDKVVELASRRRGQDL